MIQLCRPAEGGPLRESPSRQCPICGQRLNPDVPGNHCPKCNQGFPRTERGQHDFRLRSDQTVVYDFSYAPLAYDRMIDVPLKPEAPCPERRNDLRGPIPRHLTRDQVSYVPQAAEGDLALDLGCGHGIHREVVESLGYRYHGADFSGEAADDLVDAHALPYSADQYALVVSIALLEHLAQPLVALREVHRVLRPDGCFVGTVAFLEPFHDNSFFHFTHLGLWHALQFAGFSVETIMPIRGWHVARAQLEMGIGARLPGWFTRLVTQPFAWAVEFYALLAGFREPDSLRHQRGLVLARHAGAFFFVAKKEPGNQT